MAMIFTEKYVNKAILDFKKRIEEDKPYCEGLYIYATTRLLAAKYAYYILGESFLKDITYDCEEKVWYIMGRAFNILKEDETSPCIEWDENHFLAKDAMKLAKSLFYN